MQQAAEQGAVKQAEGLARLFGPQRFDAAGDVVWQAVWRQLQAKQLSGGGRWGFDRALQAGAEGAQPKRLRFKALK